MEDKLPYFRKVDVTCSTCGKAFQQRPSQAKRAKKHYCSQECHHKDPNRTIFGVAAQKREDNTIKCDYCGKSFYRCQADRQPHNYCSQDCFAKSQIKGEPVDENFSFMRTCPICQKEFRARPGGKRQGYQKYCSIQCKDEACHRVNHERREREANVACAICGKRFRVKPYNLPTAMYCSRKCQIQAKGNEGTHPEWLIEQELFSAGVDYERQVQIGPYIADFVVSAGGKGVIVEVLGDYWHVNPERYFETKYASRRDKAWKKERRRIHYLRNKGYEIYGIWESDIIQNSGAAIREIVEYILGGKKPEKSGFEYLYGSTCAHEGGYVENKAVTISI